MSEIPHRSLLVPNTSESNVNVARGREKKSSLKTTVQKDVKLVSKFDPMAEGVVGNMNH